MSKSIDWHFSRLGLAKDYLALFQFGKTSNVVLFAPRRTGKTEFVQMDLLPFAKEEGYLTITVDFWSNKSNPIAAISDGLIAAFNRLTVKEQSQLANFKGGKATASISRIFEASAETQRVDLDSLSELFNAFGFLMEKSNRQALIHLDEVQHLATDVKFDDVTASLRTFLDKSRSWLKAVMTGSSSDHLQRLFRRSRAPFYQSVEIQEFPMLGTDFVSHLLECYRAESGNSLSEREAVEFFHKLHRNPEKFRGLITAMLRAESTNFAGTWSLIQSKYDATISISEEWAGLSGAEAAVATLLLKKLEGTHSAGLYSPTTFEFVDLYVGDTSKKASKSTIQNSIEKLRTIGWVANTGHGKWEFEDSEVMAFIREVTQDC